MSDSPTGLERRQVPRIDVALPVAFTAATAPARRGMLHSLGLDGAFIESAHLVPIGDTIGMSAPLPPGGADEVRVRAKVLYHTRRGAGGAVAGFGLQFIDASRELRERIAQFIESYPGTVPIEHGVIAWPIHVASPELRWHEVAWVALDRGEAEAGDTPAEAADPERLARLFEAVRVEPGHQPRERVAFHFLARPLAPAEGVQRDWLAAVAPLAAVVAAQIRAIETLELASWTLLGVALDHLPAFEEAARQLTAARDGLRRKRSEEAHPAKESFRGALDDMLTGTAVITKFLELLLFNMNGLRVLRRDTDGPRPAP